MVNLKTALGRNGFQDWILQRVTALFIGVYTIFMFGFWLFNHKNVGLWQTLFSLNLMRYLTMLVLLAILVHAWIGLWIICTDYLKSSTLRLSAYITIYCCLLFDFIWGIQILWGAH